MKFYLTIFSVLILSIAACGTSPEPKKKGAYYLDDGPPKGDVDLAKVKDAIPRSEAYSKTGNKPYVVFGKKYFPLKSNVGFKQKGTASWYGKKFHGNSTSSGEKYDMYKMTAAHTVLPIPSYAEVTNLKNGQRVIVRINDRGPFKHNRVMDLSYAAALKLDIVRSGTGQVKIVAISNESPLSNNQPSKKQATKKSVTAKAVSQHPDNNSAPSNTQKVYIQLGAFSNQGSAEKLKQRLQADGYKNVHIKHLDRQGLSLYRVRLGPMKKLGDTDFIQGDLQHDGYTDARITFETAD